MSRSRNRQSFSKFFAFSFLQNVLFKFVVVFRVWVLFFLVHFVLYLIKWAFFHSDSLCVCLAVIQQRFLSTHYFVWWKLFVIEISSFSIWFKLFQRINWKHLWMLYIPYCHVYFTNGLPQNESTWMRCILWVYNEKWTKTFISWYFK